MVEIDVLRWHCHKDSRLRLSGDTISRHQDAVASLCYCFAITLGFGCEAASRLAKIAKIHDEAEKILGDMPGPAKARFPELAAAYEAAEREVLAEMGLHWTLTAQEADLLHLADKLDAELWARGLGVMGTHDCDKLQALADKLGLGDMVRGMME